MSAIREEEDWMLTTVPDEVWNLLMRGQTIEAMRSLRHAKGYDLRLAMMVLGKMKAMLGLPQITSEG